MDMDYLLMLQNFRESTNDLLTPFMEWMTDFSVGFWPIAGICMIYWVFDRQAGRRIFAGLGLGLLANGFLKLTFKVLRPWIRDPRIIPYGDAMTTATGYSFPSGHSTYSTAIYGGIAWWQRSRHRIISVVLVCATLIVMFSRNYLGVHTPQDVLVGCGSTLLVMFAAYKIEDWTDKDIRRDWIVMAVGLVLVAALAVYYGSMDIEAMYDSEGTLVVDPTRIKADSYQGIGSISAFVICRAIERRKFHFDTEMSMKDRFIVGTIALIPLYWWCYHIYSFCAPYSKALGSFANHAGIIVYTMLVVPFILSKIRLPKWMEE